MKWLREFLAHHAYPADEVTRAARQAGFTFDNLKEVKKRLSSDGLVSSNRGRFEGTWWCGFGDLETWKLRPAADGLAAGVPS